MGRLFAAKAAATEEVQKVMMNRRSSGVALITLAVTIAAVLLLSGCSSLGGALSSALGKSMAPSTPPHEQTSAAPAPEPAQTSATPTMAYQYQFNAFYGGMWNMGWFGYRDANYKAGQGTVWKFTNAGKGSSEPVTFERALLKVNADTSQWWRFKLDTGKETITYEFLVGPDSVVKKVRYKDPDSGTVGEFVPGKSDQQPQAGADTSSMPKSRADLAKYKVDKQKVQVKAGSFATDHYLFTDEKSGGAAESWVNETVPGYMVKSVYTSKKNNQTSTGELIQIESGVTTALGSY
jgi:hypothetical protein